MAKVLLINPQAEIGKKVKGGIVSPLGLLSIDSYLAKIISFSPLLIFPGLLCKFRWRLKFFRFPYDYKLYKWVTKKFPVY